MTLTERASEFAVNVRQLIDTNPMWQAMRWRYYVTEGVMLIADMAEKVEKLEGELNLLRYDHDNRK